MASASFLASLLIFLYVFLVFNAICNASSQEGVSLGFSMKLIHRDSPRSPHYQPSATSKDRVRAMIDRSISRARYISSVISGTSSTNSVDDDNENSDHYGYSGGGGGGVYSSITSSPSGAPSSAPTSAPSNVHSKVIPNSGDYLMELEIGTPPVKIMAVADTGSDLIWVQCKPCEQCYNQTDPIFDPSKSSTFNGSSVSCSDKICSSLLFSRCKNNQCRYDLEYGDGSVSSGTLVKDTITLSSDSNKAASIPGIVFGCSHDSDGTFDANTDGLIGLGGGPPSLVSQLDSYIHGKFSHCLVPYAENTSTSTLNFGDDSVVSGPGLVSVIMDRHKTFYLVRLQSIAAGSGSDAAIHLPPGTDIIFDSGTTITFIPNNTLTNLIAGLSKMVNLTRANDPENYFPLCYSHSSNASDPYPFPAITFNFSSPFQQNDVVSVVLTPVQTFFYISDDVICLAMHDSNEVGLPIFGNIAQQNLHIGYDLHTNVLSIAPANCSKF